VGPPPLWRGLCWRRSGAAPPPPLAVIRGAVGGVWLVFEEVYGVKWKKCEKLLKKMVGLRPKKKVVKYSGRPTLSKFLNTPLGEYNTYKAVSII
jgi:hypothetical protein